MRISHRYKFIFLSKPRCASTFVRTILDPYSDIKSSSSAPFHHHATALELKLYFEQVGWDWNDYFSFTTVRNPWEMIVSYFTFFKPDINGLYSFEKERDGHHYEPNALASFRDWIATAKTYHRLLLSDGSYITNVWVDGFSKLTLANTILGSDGKSLVNKIIKVEELGTNLSPLLKQIGIESGFRMEPLNTTSHLDYRNYYDCQTKKIIEHQFISDIEFGKYSF